MPSSWENVVAKQEIRLVEKLQEIIDESRESKNQYASGSGEYERGLSNSEIICILKYAILKLEAE